MAINLSQAIIIWLIIVPTKSSAFNLKWISTHFYLSLQDQNYFSEPEIESDYHHQHVHKSKVSVAVTQFAVYGGAGKRKFLKNEN